MYICINVCAAPIEVPGPQAAAGGCEPGGFPPPRGRADPLPGRGPFPVADSLPEPLPRDRPGRGAEPMAGKEPLLSALKGERGSPPPPGVGTRLPRQPPPGARSFAAQRHRFGRTDDGAGRGFPGPGAAVAGPAPPPDRVLAPGLGFEEVYRSFCPLRPRGRMLRRVGHLPQHQRPALGVCTGLFPWVPPAPGWGTHGR